MYSILVAPSAIRDYKKIPRAELDRINSAIEKLALTPRPAHCKKLVNRDAWRIRVGDYRIIYEINDREICIVVIRIRHRKDVYKEQ
jgi:mRNA interferase RelE/StbE